MGALGTGMGAQEVVALLVGVAAGTLGGLIGTGGCSVMLPILDFYMGLPPTLAIGTTLFAVMFTTLSGAYGHLRIRNLDLGTTAVMGGAGTVGVLIGSYIFTGIARTRLSLLNLILGAVFLLPALRMFYEGISGLRGASVSAKSETEGIPGAAAPKALFGFAIGVTTGLVGLGGGYALVPGMIYLFHAPVKLAMGTSLSTMIPLAVVGGLIKLSQGFVRLGIGLPLAAGTVVGAQLGARAIKRVRPATLKALFGAYFLYVSLKYIASYFGVRLW